MLDFAQRFAAADPATTPPDAPLPDEALALLDRVMVPRGPLPQTVLPPAPKRRRQWQLPRLGPGILVPVLALTMLAALGGLLFPWSPRPTAPEPTPMPAPSSSWHEFTTEQELVAASDAILVADAIGLEYVEVDGELYRLATVRVVSSGKGDLTGKEYLQITYPEPTAELADSPDALSMGGGTRVLLFLTTPGRIGADAELVNPVQGVFEVFDDDFHGEAVLSPGPWNPLELGPDFLKRMGIRLP